MDANIKRVLTAIYELEGLLNVVKNRDVSNRGLIDELIRDKANQISTIVNDIYTGNSIDDDVNDANTLNSDNDESCDTLQEQVEENIITEISFEEENSCESLPEPDENMSVTDINSELENRDEYALSPEEEKYRAYMPHFESEPAESKEIITDVTEDSNEAAEQEMSATEQYEKAINEDITENDEGYDSEYEDDFYDEENDIISDEDFEYDSMDDNGDYVDDLRMDEQLSRNLSKNLKKAFTLNDRFRFRRELFGNHDVEFNDTLNLVEAMHSFDEAEDYFYNDLQWDKTSPEVGDFMKIIEKHFS
ncbi:MAG: hypothetical protein J1F10_03785 [Muribaculaceae bacterium]|nr:hypothetical protein [Muribaculaceae bacterium]